MSDQCAGQWFLRACGLGQGEFEVRAPVRPCWGKYLHPGVGNVWGCKQPPGSWLLWVRGVQGTGPKGVKSSLLHVGHWLEDLGCCSWTPATYWVAGYSYSRAVSSSLLWVSVLSTAICMTSQGKLQVQFIGRKNEVGKDVSERRWEPPKNQLSDGQRPTAVQGKLWLKPIVVRRGSEGSSWK